MCLDMNDYNPSSSLLYASPHSARAKIAVAHELCSKIAAKRADITFIPCKHTGSTSSHRPGACPEAKEQAHELKRMLDCLAGNGTVVDLDIQLQNRRWLGPTSVYIKGLETIFACLPNALRIHLLSISVPACDTKQQDAMRKFLRKLVFSSGELEYPVHSPMTWVVEKTSKKMRTIDFGDDYTTSELDVVVAHARSLRRLSLGKLDPFSISRHIYQLPHLQYLNLQYHKAAGSRAFLGVLSAPLLEQLHATSGSGEVEALALCVPRLPSLRKLIVELADKELFSAPDLVAACQVVGCCLSFVLPTHTDLENLVNHPEHLDHLKLDLAERPMHDSTVSLPRPRNKHFTQLRKLDLTFQWHYSTYRRGGPIDTTTLACPRFWEYACDLLRSNVFPSLQEWSIVATTTTYTVLDDIAMVGLSRRTPKLARLNVALTKSDASDKRSRKTMLERKAEWWVQTPGQLGLHAALTLASSRLPSVL